MRRIPFYCKNWAHHKTIVQRNQRLASQDPCQLGDCNKDNEEFVNDMYGQRVTSDIVCAWDAENYAEYAVDMRFLLIYTIARCRV
jgi:hypothetical protein